MHIFQVCFIDMFKNKLLQKMCWHKEQKPRKWQRIV